MLINGIITIALGYLFGSIPVTYLVTFTFKGRDIRKTGDGTVHTSNIFRELGLGMAAVIAVLNTGKGVIACISVFLFLPEIVPTSFPWQLAALVSVAAGHIWPVFMKFRGGYGLAVSIGILAVLLPQAMLIGLAIAILLMVFFRNPVLAVNLSLISIPVTAVFQKENLFLIMFPQARLLLILFPIVLLLMLGLHFLPTAKAALAAAGSRENLAAELFRLDRGKKKVKKVKKARK
ncbi:MAG: glycerol-3-phosphate acyltransferase [Dehalococcoidales bacterium]